jgi:hypothetical protein
VSDDAPNEILAAARDAKAHQEAAKANKPAKSWPIAKIGLAAGIGSAAVAAAVLFAQRDRGDK